MSIRFGLTPTQWKAEVLAAQQYLQELAKKKDGPVTYTELFDELERQGHKRPEMFQRSSGEILGGVAQLEIDARRPPLTALVVNQDSRLPGKGFWDVLTLRFYASQYDVSDRDRAWITALNDVHIYWSSQR